MNDDRLTAAEIMSYAAPMFGMGIIMVGMTAFLPNFYTDVLFVGAGLLSVVFLVGRIWDAVTDPVMGYISDRTKTRWGRRRPYFLLSAPPLALIFYLIWSPIPSLSPKGLFVQLLVLYLMLYAFWTIFFIPYSALGAELSMDYHERTRIFGARQVSGFIGAVVGTIAFAYFSQHAGDDISTYSLLAGVCGLLTMFLILISFRGTRENPEFQRREPIPFFEGVGITFRNRAFVIILIVWVLTITGSSFLAPLTIYMAKYVIGKPQVVSGVILSYIGGAAASIYLWVKLAKRIGKNKTWTIGMSVAAVAFFLSITYHEGTWVRWLILAVIAGTGYGCATSIGPSLTADVIDSDELKTGRRREGAFFGLLTFAEKSAIGLALFIGMGGLELIGYVPNVPQTESVIWGMKFLYCLLPGVCYVAAILVFQLFPITPEIHAQIRAELDKRGAEREPSNSRQDQSR